MKSAAIRVPLHKGEETRRKLKREGILREDLYPKREDNFLILPVTREGKVLNCLRMNSDQRKKESTRTKMSLKYRMKN
ncbi:MAG: hypothetical protein FE042_06775 [Thermoplasmata archaeon]|nr:MAG: hypothetical protein FE042_06775 [Thermoplasmata archaeon]